MTDRRTAAIRNRSAAAMFCVAVALSLCERVHASDRQTIADVRGGAAFFGHGYKWISGRV